MQFFTLAALLATAIAGTQAKCTGRGWGNPSWPEDRQESKDAAAKACKTISTGEFQQNAIKWGCGNTKDKSRRSRTSASFSVQYVGTKSTAKLAEKECTSRLQAEVNGCEHGGVSTFNDFTFTSAPQYMECK